MNITEFKEKVYQRIINQYIKDARKIKPTWEDYLFIPCIFISSMIFSYFINFKKQSDIFWGTSLLPIPVLDDSEMKEFILRRNIWHCKKKYSPEELESLVAFTPKEIEDMSLISFNKEQKDFIINSVENNIKINFYSLSEMIKISVKNINQQKILAKKNIDNNQDILKAIKCDLVHEQIMPVNQKVKYLL